LRDLVDFERLAAAERDDKDKTNRRDGFPQLLSPGVCEAVGSADVGATEPV
jgi:hypothetical protein